METKLNMNPAELPTVRCRCGNFTFSIAYVLKKISALISTNGKESIAPIQIFTCDHCGTILPMGEGDGLSFIQDIKAEQTNTNAESN